MREFECFVARDLKPELSYRGEPTTDDEHFELSAPQAVHLSSQMVGIPFLLGHNELSQPLGSVIDSQVFVGDDTRPDPGRWAAHGLVKAGDWICKVALDPTRKAAKRTIDNIDLGVLPGVSLGHEREPLAPTEMSAVYKGARAGSWIVHGRQPVSTSNHDSYNDHQAAGQNIVRACAVRRGAQYIGSNFVLAVKESLMSAPVPDGGGAPPSPVPATGGGAPTETKEDKKAEVPVPDPASVAVPAMSGALEDRLASVAETITAPDSQKVIYESAEELVKSKMLAEQRANEIADLQRKLGELASERDHFADQIAKKDTQRQLRMAEQSGEVTAEQAARFRSAASVAAAAPVPGTGHNAALAKSSYQRRVQELRAAQELANNLRRQQGIAVGIETTSPTGRPALANLPFEGSSPPPSPMSSSPTPAPASFGGGGASIPYSQLESFMRAFMASQNGGGPPGGPSPPMSQNHHHTTPPAPSRAPSSSPMSSLPGTFAPPASRSGIPVSAGQVRAQALDKLCTELGLPVDVGMRMPKERPCQFRHGLWIGRRETAPVEYINPSERGVVRAGHPLAKISASLATLKIGTVNGAAAYAACKPEMQAPPVSIRDFELPDHHSGESKGSVRAGASFGSFRRSGAESGSSSSSMHLSVTGSSKVLKPHPKQYPARVPVKAIEVLSRGSSYVSGDAYDYLPLGKFGNMFSALNTNNWTNLPAGWREQRNFDHSKP